MIKLNGTSGKPIWLNPELIVSVDTTEIFNGYTQTKLVDFKEGATQIEYGDSSYIVKESPEEVVRKIIEYKLAMRFETGLPIELFMKLAGLEQTP